MATKGVCASGLEIAWRVTQRRGALMTGWPCTTKVSAECYQPPGSRTLDAIGTDQGRHVRPVDSSRNRPDPVSAKRPLSRGACRPAAWLISLITRTTACRPSTCLRQAIYLRQRRVPPRILLASLGSRLPLACSGGPRRWPRCSESHRRLQQCHHATSNVAGANTESGPAGGQRLLAINCSGRLRGGYRSPPRRRASSMASAVS